MNLTEILSPEFLIDKDFTKKVSDEVYYELQIASSEPSVIVYVYNNSASICIGTGREKDIKIESESQFSQFLETIQNTLS
ncbi:MULTISPECIES: hypothetical protein [Chryseobacterium]|jgi:hypothetical protein|uniref:hypothetical protein n=1 Tax=Chryseobacterium TaxID=59732 RepID=UPI0011AB490E|nr:MULTISPECIES: hypothetical protein [Chryseobacterium]QWT88153.1 hypothetical protein KBP46_10125 [Chryseobacterium sp. PCH239]